MDLFDSFDFFLFCRPFFYKSMLSFVYSPLEDIREKVVNTKENVTESSYYISWVMNDILCEM